MSSFEEQLLKNLNFVPNQPPFKLGKFRYGTMIHYYYDVYVSGSLEHYGEWSQLEIDFMCSLIEPGDTIVDAGAFIGTHTLAFGQKVGFDGRVLAFEPTKESFYCLTGNIMINNVYKVEAMQIALGKEEGILDLVSVGNVNKPNNYGGLGSIDYSTNETTYITKKVKMKALDSFNLTECKLIKIDVEGMSLEVLEGAKNTIEKCRPCIFTEVDDFKHQKKLIKFMKNFGYNAYDATSPLFNPNNYFKNPNNIFPGIVSFAIFCCPNDWNTTGLPKLD